MPIYEYICPKCGNKFELLKTFEKCSDEVDCPRCGTPAERRMSVCSWTMGWDFLKNVKSEPAPNDANFYPKWDS